MYQNHARPNFAGLFKGRPTAVAALHGSGQYPDVEGMVRFYQTTYGVLVVTEVTGLPTFYDACGSPIFAFHIHEGSSCTGNESDPFADVGTHYNPYGCPHPYHAGDLTPLLGADGNAFSAVLTNRFTAEEIIGRTAIIHGFPDDFLTQPSGNSGAKIACGEIVRARR